MANQSTSDNYTNNFYIDAAEQFSKNAINCSRYIPDFWRTIMLKNEPPEEFVPQQYLYECLRAEIQNVNTTSPFWFTARNSSYIKYYIALNEVLSLDFDGILVTKARHLLCCYSTYEDCVRVAYATARISCTLFESSFADYFEYLYKLYR